MSNEMSSDQWSSLQVGDKVNNCTVVYVQNDPDNTRGVVVFRHCGGEKHISMRVAGTEQILIPRPIFEF